jgi:predicted permease
MHRWVEVWRRLVALRRRDEVESGLEEEIQFHIERQTEKNLRAGMAPGEARRRALLRFGGVERVREHTRDEFRFVRVEDFRRDLRQSGRALWRARGFTVAAILTLALGIGATTAMFSVVNGVLLEPLPYPDQDRLIEVVHEAPGVGIDEMFASPAMYFTYREHARVFDAVGLWDWDRSPVTVTGRGDPEAVQSLEVTHEVLPILGVAPIIGRTFSAADDEAGSRPSVIISYGYWQRRFGGAEPLDETLVVDGVPRQVIGVLPPWFRFFTYPADIFYPLQPSRPEASFPSSDGRAIARVKEGVTLTEADADVARMIRMLGEEYAVREGFFEETRFGPKLRWLKESVVGDLGDTLWLLMGTIGLLLLIACANVANLVLVRTHGRGPELAIRSALGAGRATLARVLFTESAILGLAGGAGGLAVAYLSLPLLRSLGAADLPQIMMVRIDPTVLLVTLGVSLAATFLFALSPLFFHALPAGRLTVALHGAGRLTEGRESSRTRQFLVSAQVALALVLLVGCGLMIRTFQTLRSVDVGFRAADEVLTFQITIPDSDVAAAEPRAGQEAVDTRIRIQHAIVDGLAIAGVESTALSAFNDGLPLDGDNRSVGIYVEDRIAPDPATVSREVRFVSPGFFETLRTPVIAGRTFDWNDVYQSRRVAVVSDNMARAEWSSAQAAIGARIRTNSNGPWYEVIGVVQNIRDNGPSEPAPATVAFPLVPSNTASFLVRSARVGTPDLLQDLGSAVRSVNGNLSLAGVQILGDMYQRSMARTTMTLRLLAITGIMALVLGLVGVYGVVSYAVSQRRREIGIRLALGAAQGTVQRIFVRNAMVLVAVGVVVGLAAALTLTRLMNSLLFGVSPLDPVTYVAAALILAIAAGLASYVSARRASALDPVVVLK